ncbi:protein argonaute 1A-like [Lolium rigidum]|uniref:protein argonaute 1A-like n=1 Tax=Lolium rigidum TaxID=89674 RepID=UPI001F5DD931|nr:protein argonaute 1A-like [Lolium rigidum]
MKSLYELHDLMPDHVPPAILQALHIVLRELPTEEWYNRYAGSIYSPCIRGHQQLGDFLESRRGFHQSIRPTQSGLMLNIDQSSTVFIKPLLVMDFVKMLLNRDISDTQLTGTDLLKIVKALEGVKVHVLCNMHKEYCVSGVTSQSAEELIFPVDSHGTREPRETVLQYFQKRYGVSIQYKSLNCLQVGTPQRPKFLPLEVCKIAKGQRYSKQLNRGKQMEDFLKVAKQPPHEREKGILRALHFTHRNQCAVKLGIKIEDELVSLLAHILSPPLLKFNDYGMTRSFLPHYGIWNMMGKKMVKGGRVNSWACINFSLHVRQNEATNFCYELAIMCLASGMGFNLSPVLSVETAKPEHAQLALTSLHSNVMAKLGPGRNLDLLLVILPDKNGSLYGDLKRICETDIGLVSQCCLSKHVLRKNKQYLANVALKINVKMGGRNTVLNDALEKKLPHVGDTPTIFFGATVTHPPPGKCSSPSIASVVASQDWPEVTRYAGLVSSQPGHHEWINNLVELQYDSEKGVVTGGMIREHLISFYRVTGQKPQRIIFYRNGVSKGQYSQVLKNELCAIKLACKSLEKDYNPTITYVVVQKRHRTRLFPADYRDKPSDSTGNLWPGSVVDSVICHPDEFDFYLCSHSCSRDKGRGTIRPMYYHVLWDENKFLAGDFQTLTYYLCYMYAGCTHSISIVPPLRYARRLASRARCYTEPRSSLESGSTAISAEPVGLLPIKDSLKFGMFFC